MPDPFAPAAAPRRGNWRVLFAVGALLTYYVLMAATASRQKGLSFDEGEEIVTGYTIWKHGDFRMEGANGDLVKRWATLPLLVSNPALPAPDLPAWRRGEAYKLAYSFFFDSGNDPRVLLRQCRSMMLVLGVGLGLLVFYYSRKLFGNLGGLISLTLFVSSPSMLAFGMMVSTEMPACLTLLGATWSIWRVLHRVTWGRLAASLIFVGLLLLSKPTAIVMVPITALLIAIKLGRGQPLEWRLGTPRIIAPRQQQFLIFAGLFALHVLAGWTAIWAHYDFRYRASPDPAAGPLVVTASSVDPVDPTTLAFLRWSRRTHFLPEGFLHGIESLLRQNESQVAFMNGQWKYGGWPAFFPYAMWVKTQPALILLLVLAVIGWVALRKSPAHGLSPVQPGRPATAGSSLYDAAPLVVMAAVYFGMALTWDLNIGFRHALPIYPAFYILCGALAFVWIQRGVIAHTAIVLLLAWHFSGPMTVYPHYLAYFSPVAGGPTQGYKRLVDSSLDWGMDLPGLKQWLDVHNPGGSTPFFLAYFGVGNPDHYKIKSFRLPGWPDWRPGNSFPYAPGIYAISATLFQGIGTQTAGPWNKLYEQAYQRALANINLYDVSLRDPQKHAELLARYPQTFWDSEYTTFDKLRFARLCAWLRHKRVPDDQVGYAILIWHLDAAELTQAGLGPPVELAEAPLHR